ncbi:MAG: DUF5069 domain-containing protein [Chloroflexi bacterium]|nr:DUF5069 domain-containing protein [Chloroflexota bacterium]
MDLTKAFPRSPRITVHGVAMVARTADKARADASGTHVDLIDFEEGHDVPIRPS